jgi:RNA polymerase sigma factor (sigma-70 family)
LAAVPSIGRAARVERPAVRGAEATRDLYERYSAQIFGYCMHQLGSREEAEDAVQTTFMNAFRGLQRGIVPELESAWLFKIAHNVCLSRRRSSWRRGRVEAPNNLEVLQEVVPARERRGDELIRLQAVLEEMPENQRRAILLREWQGLTYREISDELRLSQSAVETLIFRARRALAAGLEKSSSGEDDRGWRKRVRHGADAGAVAIGLKTLLSGGTAAKVAATALVLAATTIASPIGSHRGSPAPHESSTGAQSSLPTSRAPALRTFSATVPTAHHATPAPAPAKPKPASPTTPKPSMPSTAPEGEAPPTQTSAPEPKAAPPEPKPVSYEPSPSPPGEQSGKSANAPGKAHAHEPPPAPPAADPAPAAEEHGKDTAPGQQDKPEKDNGSGAK